MNLLLQIYEHKKNASIPQQINFIQKLKEDNGETMLFCC